MTGCASICGNMRRERESLFLAGIAETMNCRDLVTDPFGLSETP
jgi:hypothetical protein